MLGPMVQDYETVVHPMGCTLKFVLTSTWGDPHYIGMNALQVNVNCNM